MRDQVAQRKISESRQISFVVKGYTSWLATAQRYVSAKGADNLRTVPFNEVTDHAPIDFADVGRAISFAQAPDDMLISIGLDEHHVGLRTVARIDTAWTNRA